MSHLNRNDISTKAHVVQRMCELCEPDLSDIHKSIFEPGCGTGNFLVEILRRRLLKSGPDPQRTLVILTNLYGIDASARAVEKVRERMRTTIIEFFGEKLPENDRFLGIADRILTANVLQADLLGDLAKTPIAEWEICGEYDFREVYTTLAELLTNSGATEQKTAIKLRNEQKAAIEQAFEFWKKAQKLKPEERKFLWNAKPRFGKTLTAYKFAEKINAQRTLILTNRPAAMDAWASDFFRFIQPGSKTIFASQKGGEWSRHRIFSRNELLKSNELLNQPLYYFISLQDLKGRNKNTKDFKEQNQWIFEIRRNWDLVIVDESHDGVATTKTQEILGKIRRNFTLHLSGTPFRALANQEFGNEQIYNWTYLDEQLAKKKWRGQPNPYTELPDMNFWLYDLPNSQLGEMFRTRAERFIHEDLVGTWIDSLAATPNFPFCNKNIQDTLRHTLWVLSGVDECKALGKMLSAHKFFGAYKIVIVAGRSDNESSGRAQRALKRVREAIGANPNKSRTITLSCGRLTTGVTVPEWGGVMMLQNNNDLSKSSAAPYIQAAFRTQSPFRNNGFMKKRCFVFDFAPERALTMVQEYATNLCARSLETENDELNATKKLVKVMPVAKWEHGVLRTLNATECIELPKKYIAREIINGKFVTSNMIFNLEKISQLSNETLQILNKLQAYKKHGSEKEPSTALNSDDIGAVRVTRPAKRTKQQQHVTEAYRDKLRSLTRRIPMLLHLYGKDNTAFGNLETITTPKNFEEVAGITVDEFNLIRREGYFREENCDLAIREFLAHKQATARYYQNCGPASVTDYIPLQDTGHVFASQEVVDKMLDTIEQQDPEVFRDPRRRFLDLSSKSGLFAANVIRRLYKNLRRQFQSDETCLQHIVKKQIFAWAPDEVALETTLKTVFNFGDECPVDRKWIRNFVIYNPSNGKSSINSLVVKEKIATIWGEDMKFDIILGNPPYQSGRRQIYADFYRLAVDLDPDLLCMIFPIGWQKVSNTNGLKSLNDARYKRDSHIVSIDNYYETTEQILFPEVRTGGVNIVLRHKRYDNNGSIQKLEYGKTSGEIVLPLKDEEIVKPQELKPLYPLAQEKGGMDGIASSRRPYGLDSGPLRQPSRYKLGLSEHETKSHGIKLFGLMKGGDRGYLYMRREDLPRRKTNLDQYKVFVPKAWGNMSKAVGLGGSYSNICVASPGSACTETFIEFGPFGSRMEAMNAAKYFMTKFFRACLFLAKNSQNTAKDKYRYVPKMDFSTDFWNADIDELDEKIFTKYKLPKQTREFIRRNFQARSEQNIDEI